MTSTRLWIVLLTLVSFLAGVAAGLLGSEYSLRAATERREDGDFVRRFSEVFDLDPEGRRLLAERQAAYHAQIESIELRNEVRRSIEAHALMEPELLEAGRVFRSDVRDMLLVTEAQRKEFDRLMADYVENL